MNDPLEVRNLSKSFESFQLRGITFTLPKGYIMGLIDPNLERAADYITYISYGELFFSGGKDEFVDSFKIVKGGREELSADLRNKALGIREYTTGFEALVKTGDLKQFAHLNVEPAEM